MKFKVGDMVTVNTKHEDYSIYNGVTAKICDLTVKTTIVGDYFWTLDTPKIGKEWSPRFFESELEHAYIYNSPLYKALL